MSLTTANRPVAIRKLIAPKWMAGILIGIATAVILGTVFRELSEDLPNAVPTSKLSVAEFVELNTTSLPPTAPVVDVGASRTLPPDRFLRINTVDLPSSPPRVWMLPDDYEYWHHNSLLMDDIGGGVAAIETVTPEKGPR